MEINIRKYNYFGTNLAVLVGLFSIPITLIFSIKLNVMSVALLVISAIWHRFTRLKTKDKICFSKLDVLYLFSFFIIQVWGLVYTIDYGKGIKEIETKFSFFLFPVIFVFFFKRKTISKRLIHLIILVFGICIILFFYVYLIPFWVLYTDMQIKSLNTLIPNELKHVYFGLFSVFSFFSFYLFFRDSNKKSEKKYLFFAMSLLFLIPIILTARIATFLSLLIVVFLIFFDKKNRKRFIALFLFTVLLFSYCSISYPKKIKRFKNIFMSNEFYNPIYHRKNNIECAFNIFLDKPVIGVGTGSVQTQLNKCYAERKYWGLKYQYNVHNEYLEEGARHGIIGFFAIIFLFLFPLIISIKEKNYLYTGFLIIIMVSALTESIFSRQVGVVFFSFFNTLFYLNLQNKKNE